MAGTVLFDWDGTLACRDGSFGRVLLDVIREHEPEHPVTIRALRVGLQDGFPWHRPATPHPELNGDADAWWARLEPTLFSACLAAGVDVDLSATAADAVRARFSDPDAWQLFPETEQVLDYLQAAGMRLAIVSNAVPELLRIVAGLGVADRFDAIISSAVVGYEKPHSEIFRIALRAVGRTERAWVVGDDRGADIGGAESLGLPGVLVRTPGADGVALDLLDAAQLVLRDWRGGIPIDMDR